MKDFITRCEQLFSDEIKENEKISRDKKKIQYQKLKSENPEKIRKWQDTYLNTDMGSYCISKKSFKHRVLKMKMEYIENDISYEEKILIGRFYRNCPAGYEVDHIVPVSKGGKHVLSNLQYLTEEENERKGSRLPGELTEIQMLKTLHSQIDEYLKTTLI